MTTVNVVVGRKRDIQVSANATSGSISTNRNPVTLKNVSTMNIGRLDSLNDVVATGEINGAVPVYDASSDKYVVQKLDLSNVSGDLDGGTF
jgi:hypothetical protein